MISVIIPIFNEENYLHICLNSILMQSYEDFEVICIDDASTDSSFDILDYFSAKDSRIKIFKNESRKGFEFCKKRGLAISNGEKILFLDSNDWLSFDSLEISSKDTDPYIKNKLSNKISDFMIETSKSKNPENVNYNKIIQKSKDDKIQLQKILGKYRKQSIIKKIINKDYSNITIAIKSPHPKSETHWGDLFFSIALKKSFEKLGFNVIIQEREYWYDEDNIDIAFVLRGLIDYNPDYSKINIMWNISHPDMVSKEEYEKYDQVFISSKKYANKIKNQVNTNVAPLLQCTDPEVFYREIDDDKINNLLFVGVTRGVYRKIIHDVLQTNHDVSIYGMGWKKYVDEKYIKGDFIPNKELHKYYSSCKILLNDHWEDMRDEDFPSNRLFDALACGTFVISDKIPSADTLFEGSIVTYENIEDLNEKIDYYLTHDDERVEIAKKGQKLVLEYHTFDNRVEEILAILNKIEF